MWGAWITGIITVCAAGMFAAAAVLRTRQARIVARSPGLLAGFYALVALTFLISALRLFWAASDGAYIVDRYLFYGLTLGAGLSVVPLMALHTRLATGDARLARLVGVAFTALVATAWLALAMGGTTGPVLHAWGSDWDITSPITLGILVGAGLLPTAVASIWIVFAARGLDGDERARLEMIAGASATYVMILALGAIGIYGAWMVVERTAYLLIGAAFVLAERRIPWANLRAAVQARAPPLLRWRGWSPESQPALPTRPPRTDTVEPGTGRH